MGKRIKNLDMDILVLLDLMVSHFYFNYYNYSLDYGINKMVCFICLISISNRMGLRAIWDK